MSRRTYYTWHTVSQVLTLLGARGMFCHWSHNTRQMEPTGTYSILISGCYVFRFVEICNAVLNITATLSRFVSLKAFLASFFLPVALFNALRQR